VAFHCPQLAHLKLAHSLGPEGKGILFSFSFTLLPWRTCCKTPHRPEEPRSLDRVCVLPEAISCLQKLESLEVNALPSLCRWALRACLPHRPLVGRETLGALWSQPPITTIPAFLGQLKGLAEITPPVPRHSPRHRPACPTVPYGLARTPSRPPHLTTLQHPSVP